MITLGFCTILICFEFLTHLNCTFRGCRTDHDIMMAKIGYGVASCVGGIFLWPIIPAVWLYYQGYWWVAIPLACIYGVYVFLVLAEDSVAGAVVGAKLVMFMMLRATE